jgi:hypothetical protein
MLVMTACTLLVFSPIFTLKADQLSMAVTLDLTITAPLLYFLVIRRTQVSKMTVIRVFVVGLALAGLLLYNKPHFVLSLLKTWAAPLAEGALLFLIAKRFYRAGRVAKKLGKEERQDVLSRCRVLLTEVTGNEKAGGILASEMAVLYYAFVPRKKAKARAGCGFNEPSPAATFTSYKTNGILLVLGVFFFCFLVETVGLHFLLALWNKKLAWILTTLGAYTALQLYAHMRAVRARPIRIGEESLQLRNGLVADAAVLFGNIDSIEFDRQRMGSGRGEGQAAARPAGKAVQSSLPAARVVKLALIKGLENHNILLRLKQPILVHRPFGIRQEADTLLFFVDRPEEFLAAVREKLSVQELITGTE